MEFPDYPITINEDTSYPGSNEILKYLESYADSFKLADVIKLRHYVIRVRPIENERWEVCTLTTGK